MHMGDAYCDGGCLCAGKRFENLYMSPPKASVNGESKLQQCLNLSCDKKKVARFVSCDLWNDI
jgi:hypothetical protein